MLNRQSRLQEMEQALQSGLNAKGDSYRQHQAINTIIRHARLSDEPVLEWLLRMGNQLNQPQNQPTQTDPPTFVCHKCADKPAFKSQKALNGHMKKHIG